jgi:hypothetical protein
MKNLFYFISLDYSLNDIPCVQLSKRLNRRLIHIRQTLEIMSANEIELKLKYKRDGKHQ